MKKLADIFAFIFLFYMLIDAVLPSKPKPSVSLKDASAYLERAWKGFRRDNIVDGVLLIEQDGKVIFSDGDPTESYPLASLSKSFVGFRFRELQKAGKIDVEEKACHWMQNFCAGKLKTISLHQLLDHRAGFGRDLSLFYFLERLVDPGWNLYKLDNLKVSDSSLKFTPGADFTYSNFGYLLLSRVLEKVEGKNFSEIIKDLANRYHLKSIRTAVHGETFPNSFVVPKRASRWSFDFEGDSYKAFGTGGIVSNAQDLLRWLKVLEENEGLPTQSPQQYQSGIVRGEKTFWHNGATPGMYGLMATVPEQELKVVMLTKNFKITKLWAQEIENLETLFY